MVCAESDQIDRIGQADSLSQATIINDSEEGIKNKITNLITYPIQSQILASYFNNKITN